MSVKRLVLNGRNTTRLQDGMAEIGWMASAISGLHGVMNVITDLENDKPCPQCDPYRQRLVSKFTVGSLQLAVAALADSICGKGEALERIIADGVLMDE